MAYANELRACPFCGGSARLEVAKMAFVDVEVSCDGCAVSGPNCDDGELTDNRREAIEHWNTRALIASREAAVKPLGDDAGLVAIADVLRLLDESCERWKPLGGDPVYIDGYETGVADATMWLAEDVKDLPGYFARSEAHRAALAQDTTPVDAKKKG